MRHLLIFFLLLNLSVGLVLATDVTPVEIMDEDSVVPEDLRVAASQDMMALGKLSRDHGVPILLVFSTEECVYCKRLEAEVLGPLRLSGVDPERIILRKVIMDEYDTLRDFSGHKRNAENFGIDRGIDVVPTVQLVDATGRELVPKIVGYRVPGLYDSYQKAIDVSRGLLLEKE